MRSVIRSYRDLEVWRDSVDLYLAVTDLTRRMPRPDRWVFEVQARRAARSIAANIAEGQQRYHLMDYLRHLSFARGSTGEVDSDLVLIEKSVPEVRHLIPPCVEQADCVSRKLTSLAQSLRRHTRA